MMNETEKIRKSLVLNFCKNCKSRCFNCGIITELETFKSLVKETDRQVFSNIVEGINLDSNNGLLVDTFKNLSVIGEQVRKGHVEYAEKLFFDLKIFYAFCSNCKVIILDFREGFNIISCKSCGKQLKISILDDDFIKFSTKFRNMLNDFVYYDIENRKEEQFLLDFINKKYKTVAIYSSFEL